MWIFMIVNGIAGVGLMLELRERRAQIVELRRDLDEARNAIEGLQVQVTDLKSPGKAMARR
jgi:hypothetical protein